MRANVVIPDALAWGRMHTRIAYEQLSTTLGAYLAGQTMVMGSLQNVLNAPKDEVIGSGSMYNRAFPVP